MININRARAQLSRSFEVLRNGFKRSWLVNKEVGPAALVSLSLIGRKLVERRVDQVMDIDVVVILRDPMTVEKLREVSRIFEELRNDSTNEVRVSYRIADGPIKPLPSADLDLFFHVLLHTIESYVSSPLVLVKNSWQYDARTIIGAPLADIQRIPGVFYQELVYGKLGIRHCHELIQTSGSACLEWLPDQTSGGLALCLRPVKFCEPQELLEICYYSVLRSASNALRFAMGRSKDIGIDTADMRLFARVFHDLRQADLPIQYYQEKIRLRQGLWKPGHNETGQRVLEALDFLVTLETDISNRVIKSEPIWESSLSCTCSTNEIQARCLEEDLHRCQPYR